MFRNVAFALAASGLCMSAPARADDAEDRAVAVVEKMGGRVTRDDKEPGKPVTAVNLSFTQVTDAELKELAPLKSLTTLYLCGTQVTDAGIKELQKALPKCRITK